MATNLDDSAKDIIEVSSKRYKIEDCFRVMKTNFGVRPVFHQTREHITAHFMICYTALLIYRLLEKKIHMSKIHFTVENIIETLKNMEVANIEDVCYMSTYTCSQVCEHPLLPVIPKTQKKPCCGPASFIWAFYAD